jgi:hypothetical protein
MSLTSRRPCDCNDSIISHEFINPSAGLIEARIPHEAAFANGTRPGNFTFGLVLAIMPLLSQSGQEEAYRRYIGRDFPEPFLTSAAKAAI